MNNLTPMMQSVIFAIPAICFVVFLLVMFPLVPGMWRGITAPFIRFGKSVARMDFGYGLKIVGAVAVLIIVEQVIITPLAYLYGML